MLFISDFGRSCLSAQYVRRGLTRSITDLVNCITGSVLGLSLFVLYIAGLISIINSRGLLLIRLLMTLKCIVRINRLLCGLLT